MKREFFIAGVQFRPKDDIAKAMKEIKVETNLRMLPEPDNKYDPNAVMITLPVEELQEEFFLGYVPKKYSSEVAGLLEAGIELTCKVVEVSPQAKPWEMFKVVIQDIKEEGDNN